MIKNKGFTLTELLIVIAIIGILTAIVLPSYQEHIRKSNRVVAILKLTKEAQQFERVHARQGAYPIALTQIEDTDTYTFLLVDPDPTDDIYQITATPIGSNASDECGTLSIDQAGRTSASIATGCWD